MIYVAKDTNEKHASSCHKITENMEGETRNYRSSRELSVWKQVIDNVYNRQAKK